METVRALFAGLATWDVIHLVDQLPHPDQKVAARDFACAAGGPATNAAVAFAHCGGAPTLVTALPDHALTAAIADDLAGCGVELAVAGTYAGPPVTASILVTAGTGERAVVSPYASVRLEVHIATPDAWLDGASAVLIDGHFRELSLPLARAARERGIPVILDAGSVKPYTQELLAHVDIAVVSSAFAPGGDALDYLAEAGVQRAVVTAGGGRIRWRTPAGEGELDVPAVPAVDTLGAGDFFHGAFAFCIASHGLDDDALAEDLLFAADIAARSVTSFGTRTWLTSS